MRFFLFCRIVLSIRGNGRDAVGCMAQGQTAPICVMGKKSVSHNKGYYHISWLQTANGGSFPPCSRTKSRLRHDSGNLSQDHHIAGKHLPVSKKKDSKIYKNILRFWKNTDALIQWKSPLLDRKHCIAAGGWLIPPERGWRLCELHYISVNTPLLLL